MATGRRTWIIWLAIGLLASALVLVSPTSTSASDEETVLTSRCPELTDSIRRLYLAYFNREPDAGEFLQRTTEYQTAQLGLPAISEQLVSSQEFKTRYGSLSDERFVELAYRNALRRAPDDEGREHWTSSLDAGYSRGLMMLAFTESEEFVRRTRTVTPMAGYLRWYPDGAHWYCGVGPAPDVSIRPLVGATQYADFMLRNGGDKSAGVSLFVVDDDDQHIPLTATTLSPGFTDYTWDGAFSGDGEYGSILEVEAGLSTTWAVVFYPTSIGQGRLGWQIAR